jgi:hypothetical protein
MQSIAVIILHHLTGAARLSLHVALQGSRLLQLLTRSYDCMLHQT